MGIRSTLFALTCVAALAVGCGGDDARTSAPYSSYPQTPQGAPSLFPGDGAVLSDADIARILQFRQTVQAKSRIAVLQLGGRADYDWMRGATTTARASLGDTVAAVLTAHERVSWARVLPAMLVPGKVTVAALREAAARYQADMLVVFQPDCETFRDGSLFRADSVNANCKVELVLLDVRTGIIPFNRTVIQRLRREESEARGRGSEAMLRAELLSLAGALRESSAELLKFLEGAPLAAGASPGAS